MQDSRENSILHITVEFTGGLEMLFGNKSRNEVRLPRCDADGAPVNVSYLVQYVCEHLIQDKRKELFVLDGAIRPGILVLINDADWELEGEDKYEIADGDNFLFVSTLHGG